MFDEKVQDLIKQSEEAFDCYEEFNRLVIHRMQYLFMFAIKEFLDFNSLDCFSDENFPNNEKYLLTDNIPNAMRGCFKKHELSTGWCQRFTTALLTDYQMFINKTLEVIDCDTISEKNPNIMI